VQWHSRERSGLRPRAVAPKRSLTKHRCPLPRLKMPGSSRPASLAEWQPRVYPGDTPVGQVSVDETLERLKAALADRYTLEKELGRGGMATVYLTRGPKHDRPVAHKVLRPVGA
jgi:hypothetical protein